MINDFRVKQPSCDNLTQIVLHDKFRKKQLHKKNVKNLFTCVKDLNLNNNIRNDHSFFTKENLRPVKNIFANNRYSLLDEDEKARMNKPPEKEEELSVKLKPDYDSKRIIGSCTQDLKEVLRKLNIPISNIARIAKQEREKIKKENEKELMKMRLVIENTEESGNYNYNEINENQDNLELVTNKSSKLDNLRSSVISKLSEFNTLKSPSESNKSLLPQLRKSTKISTTIEKKPSNIKVLPELNSRKQSSAYNNLNQRVIEEEQDDPELEIEQNTLTKKLSKFQPKPKALTKIFNGVNRKSILNSLTIKGLRNVDISQYTEVSNTSEQVNKEYESFIRRECDKLDEENNEYLNLAKERELLKVNDYNSSNLYLELKNSIKKRENLVYKEYI